MSIPLRVLIVEDLEHEAELIERELLRGGYGATIERVKTPAAMATALDKQTWDIISFPTKPRVVSANRPKSTDLHDLNAHGLIQQP